MSRPTLDGIKQASVGAFDKAKLMVGLRKDEEDDEESNQSESVGFVAEAAELLCPDLSFQQRLIGFGTCFTVGYLITFMSFKFFEELLAGNAVPFSLNYTFGNLLSLGASGFLCGPKRQFRRMLDESRRLTAITYLSCLAGTLVLAFVPIPIWEIKLFGLIFLLLAQFGASFWYSLSYVPYGRRTVISLVRRYFGLHEQPVEGNIV